MPLYTLECNACGHTSEWLATSSSVASPACDECGKPTRRLMGNFAVAGASGGLPCDRGACCAPQGGHSCGSACACH